MSAKYEDAMGDMLKAHEAKETERRVAPGECAMIRLDGMSFSKFTGSMVKPFDRLMADAMRATAMRALEVFGPNFVYTQSDEITMVFSPERMPFDGRLQKMAGGYAGKISTFFMAEAMKRFANGVDQLRMDVDVARDNGYDHDAAVELADHVRGFIDLFDRLARAAPAFDGRAIGVDHEMAAQFVVWREVDARRNAALGAGRAEFTQSQLGGKSPGDIKDMLTALGIDYYDRYPNQFRRGIFMRKREVAMSLTEEELARIPEHVRESKRGTTFLRSKAVEVEERGPFYEMDNIVEVLFEDADPVVVEKPFARHIVP
ncbi:tRNA(His) guanylyltransferase Thg1 family protein [Rhizobium sp. BK176]|uniref:tRNA(His) guanylyltransferase Thg1 family protein n=1 Tax=Rhizobium sp. BK176 TaxID=2587071 RepID=UPI002167E03B|nr:tRNA(His) guanylyltransferase Thg1 family protein [Rhizobium sp. BK176]MCS4089588.1 tRNA(His) 5'-end guanylyltransferase [Rhizobium sp. BK176]